MINEIKNNKIGIILTDTVYGIIGSALKEEVVEKIYKVKKRNLKKPMVVLISSIEDLNIFKIELTDIQKSILKELWQKPTSVILNVEGFEYLHRGLNSIAFRLPCDEKLKKEIKEVGPIVATSANKEGEEIVKNIKQAKEIFKDEIDFYIDSGKALKEPSFLVRLEKEDVYFLRGKVCLKG